MQHLEKTEKLKAFKNEKEFRLFLIDLLKHMGFKNVQLTHKYGEVELGKDIIASFAHDLEGEEWYAFVVKHGRILGGTDQIETIKNQIMQSFEYPYQKIDGQIIKINKSRVVTNEHISKGAVDSIRSSKSLNVYTNYDFWWNEKLIEYIDEYYIDFWLSGDFLSKEYKKALSNSIKNEFEIKELSMNKLSDTKVQKLLDLFIEPHLIEFSSIKDKLLNNKIKQTRVIIESIVESTDNFIIEGDPGSGKSRLINKLICLFLETLLLSEKKIFPVKLKLKILKENNFDIAKSVIIEISKLLPEGFEFENVDGLNFVVFIDSIDDLYSEDIAILASNISNLLEDPKYRFIISARSIKKVGIKESGNRIRELYLQNFNQRQIELFIYKYFEDNNRGKRLLDVLKESNILIKLPTTPLTITLISILYEDTDYEIPATITDIYNDFINILIGKLEIRTKAQLIDLELKKRIFSHISFQMLNEKKFELDKSEFIERICSFLSPKGKEIPKKEDFERLLNNSGIIYIDNNNMVGFKHLSFLEYFASYEIFYVMHSYGNLISNFNDVNWQNAAIFYAGFSKDMPQFIAELVVGAPNNILRDRFFNIGGMGYLSQALYMTDIKDRIKLIEHALDNMIISFQGLKELTRKGGFYNDMSLHIIGSMLVFWFNLNFKSTTLAECLELLYDKYINDFKDNLGPGNFEIGFKLFLIATTLSSEYLGRYKKLNDIIERDCFIKDPLLVVLCEIFLDFHEIDSKFFDRKKRKKIESEKKRYKKMLNNIIKEPAYRFGEDYKRIKKTD